MKIGYILQVWSIKNLVWYLMDKSINVLIGVNLQKAVDK